MRKYQDQIKSMQSQVEEEQRARDDAREQMNAAERRANSLQGEVDEVRTNLEQAERQRKHVENELNDANDSLSQLSSTNIALSGHKRKLEAELGGLHVCVYFSDCLLIQSTDNVPQFQFTIKKSSYMKYRQVCFVLQHELVEMLNEVKLADDKSKAAMADAARLADELRQEQEHAMHVDRNRKVLEVQVKELQVRLDEAEGASIKGGRKAIQKLEERCREMENELDAEQRRHAETLKNIRKHER